MADNQTIAVYHHNIGTFDFGSGFSSFPMAGVSLSIFESGSRSIFKSKLFLLLDTPIF